MLIGVVVWVIVARARLATTGGTLARGAERIATAALGTSIGLNLVAALPHEPLTNGANGVTAMIGSMIAHAIGPIGAAATAYLIGVVDASVTAADPWAGTDHPTPTPSIPTEPTRASSTARATTTAKSVTNTTPTPSLNSAPKIDDRQSVEAGPATPDAAALPAKTGRSEVSDKNTEPDADLAAWVRQESEAGRSVTGTTVAAYLGVSPATGRRRLAAIKETDETPT